MAAGTLAADRRRPRTGRGQRRHTGAGWTAVGHHLRLRALGIESAGGDGSRRRLLAVLARVGGARGERLQRHHSVMNMGILLGALTTAGMAGRFAPVWRIPARSLAAALIGDCCWDMGPVSPMDAISARSSAALPRRACTVGSGWSRPSPEARWASACGPGSGLPDSVRGGATALIRAPTTVFRQISPIYRDWRCMQSR